MTDTEELTDEMKAAIIARIEAEVAADVEQQRRSKFNGQPRKDFIFQTAIGKFLFEGVAWSEHTDIQFFINEEKLTEENKKEETSAFMVTLIDDLFKRKQGNIKICRSARYNSAEDFHFCLCSSQIEFLCINKPVLTPIFDYDCLREEELKKRRELEKKYRAALMPPRITCEFPVSIPYRGQNVPCIVRFRDTSWYEIDRFTVALAEGESIPAGWQKNEYGEYAFPSDDLWKARGFSKIFPAYDMQCSPYRMYLRLGKTPPLNLNISNIEEPPLLPMFPC